MASVEEAAQDYLESLKELTANNKTQINLLTILAEDYIGHAPIIVQTIERRILEAPREVKLFTLYVIDSIIKNVGKDYPVLFSKGIVNTFLHVFINSEEKTRASLYKLRQTWNGIFTNGTLYKLDMRVKQEDPAWPLAAPNRQPAAVAPQRRPPPTTTVASNVAVTASSSSTHRVHVNPKFIQADSSKDAKTGPSASTTELVRSENGNTLPKQAKREVKPTTPLKDPRKPTISKSEPEDVVGQILSLPDSRPIKEEPDEPVPPVPQRSPEPFRQAPVPVVKRRIEDRSELERKKWKTDRVERPPQRDKDFRMLHSHQPHAAASHRPPPRINTPPLAAKTTLPGAHAFSAPVLAAVSSTAPVPSQPSPTVSAAVPNQSQVMPPNRFPLEREPQRQVAPALQPNFPPAPVIHRPQPTPSFPPAAPAPTAPPVPRPQHAQISHEGGRIEAPANNRLFVDGRAHEVIYVNDTAVIERNGLPHKIYFSGPPRNVIIDGQVHVLNFGERKTVYIDNQPHVLRFGAPSKELYMGDFPFRGQFGGNPIVATINGVRHEIRLSGPAPEVKIEQEPAYDLARFMNQAREGRVAEKPQAETAVDFLLRLKNSGILGRAAAASMAQAEPAKTRRPAPIHRNNRDVTPPIPSDTKLDSIERKHRPTQQLKDFNIRLLQVRYDETVARLHEKPKNACELCGMKMDTVGSEKYNRHMDWHVRRNLQTLDRVSSSRPWYSSKKDWLKSEEEVTDSTQKDVRIKEESTTGLPVASSSDAPSKECGVCGETFEEYFDEDDDVWKLRNCILIEGRPFHSGCHQDASVLEPVNESSSDLGVVVNNDIKPLNIFNKSEE